MGVHGLGGVTQGPVGGAVGDAWGGRHKGDDVSVVVQGVVTQGMGCVLGGWCRGDVVDDVQGELSEGGRKNPLRVFLGPSIPSQNRLEGTNEKVSTPSSALQEGGFVIRTHMCTGTHACTQHA